MIGFIFKDLTYSSLAFFLFLFCFLLVYFVIPKNWMKISTIICGNFFFYIFASGIRQLLGMLFTAIGVYFVTIVMDSIYSRAEEVIDSNLSAKKEVEFWKKYKKKCKIWLYLGIALALVPLLCIKVSGMLGHGTIVSDKMIIPLGVSYYSFSLIGYLIDTYKRKISIEKNIVVFLAVVTFFPIIVEGPISKIENLCHQFRSIPKFEYERLCYGMQRVVWGLLKKLVIADRISPTTTLVFSNIFDYAGIEIIIAIVLAVFSLYADFSGCMDIVIGVAEVMGVALDENFKQPFFSASVSDFWRRWHITLFAWFRDYIYIPITQNSSYKKLNKIVRKKVGKEFGAILVSAIPTFIVWTITGFWHGTGKDYMLWGGYWFIITMCSQLIKPVNEKMNNLFGFRSDTLGWNIFRIARTNLIYSLGGFFIISGSAYGVRGCLYLVRQILIESRIWELFNGGIFSHGIDKNSFIIIVLAIFMVMFVDYFGSKGINVRVVISEQPLFFRWSIWFVLITTVVICGQYGPGYNSAEFVYAGF